MLACLTTILFAIVTRTVAEVCNYENSVELTDRSYNGIKYEDGEYFVDNKTGVERGCVCMKQRCVRKCCPFGQGYSLNKNTCVDIYEEFDPPVWEGSEMKTGFNASREFHFLFFKVNCSKEKNEFRIAVRSATPDYHLNTDGKLYVTMEDSIPSHLIYSSDKYCVDNFISDDDGSKTEAIEYDGLICFIPMKESGSEYILTATCMLISCFFIILTIAVYAFLPELKTLHGMVMTACLVSFFMGFLFMATMQILQFVGIINQNCCTGMSKYRRTFVMNRKSGRITV